MEKLKKGKYSGLIEKISELVSQSRGELARAINTRIVQTYWAIGKHIVEYFDMLFSEGCLEYSCALESRGSATNFTVRNNIFVDFDSHTIDNSNSVFKGFETNEAK